MDSNDINKQQTFSWTIFVKLLLWIKKDLLINGSFAFVILLFLML